MKHNKNFLARRISSLFIGLLCLTLLVNVQVATTPASAASPAPAWHDTGFSLPAISNGTYLYQNFGSSYQNLCFDGSQPDIVLLNNASANSFGAVGSYKLNWRTGQKTLLSSSLFTGCNEANGWLYTRDENYAKFSRFSSSDPQPRSIEHYPTAIASDGSGYVYALSQPSFNFHFGVGEGKLWASSDNGLTWQQRNGSLGPIASVVVSQPSGQDIYALTYTFNQTNGDLTYSIYFSPDAGLSWQKRYDGKGSNSGFGAIGLSVLKGRSTAVDTILLVINNGIPGSNSADNFYLSIDGARSFNQTGGHTVFSRHSLYQTSQGVLRLTGGEQQGRYDFSVTKDGGKSWLPLTLPFKPYGLSGTADILQPGNAPDNLFLYSRANGVPEEKRGSPQLWYSTDAGINWQQLATPNPNTDSEFYVSPYLPLTLLATQYTGTLENGSNKLFAYDLPDAGKTFTNGVVANGASGGQYFMETGHNTSPLFQAFWQTHGGLAQFGYPKTEAFRELNPTDGKVYTVQYFERNRFEYHPEFVGTAYEVELGLLGNQLTAPRRAAGDGAFNFFADAHYVGGIYFSQTGHNLRNSFKDYWLARGGLAIFGYPISEEFYEVNPDDGQTYVVQYFERNRFEYHPDYAGTPYEVELGLLGNTLLKQKGWLP